MTQPDQVLPSWLTYSRSVITNAAGAPVSTSTTILYLPLTYYGPSIPLGPDWTYGGLTSPAPTSSTSRPITTIPATPTITTTSARPPTSSSVSSTTSRPTSSITPTTGSVPASTTRASTTSTSTSSGTPVPTLVPASQRLTKPALIGAILGAILGSVVLLLALLLYVRIRVGKRQRNHSSIGGWSIVDAGDGSPHQSGDEADPFLNRNGARAPTQWNVLPAGSPPTARLVSPPAVRPHSGNGFGSGRGRGVSTASSTFTAATGGNLHPAEVHSDSSSTGSGYGNLITSGFIVPPGEIQNDEMGYKFRTQYPSSDLERTDEIDEPPEERSKPSPVPEHLEYLDELTEKPEEYSPNHPPKAFDSDRSVGFALLPTYTHEKPTRRSFNSRPSSYPADGDEAPLLVTGQRNLGSRPDGPSSPSSAWQGLTDFAKNIIGSLSSRRGSRNTLSSRPSVAPSHERERKQSFLSAAHEKAELGMRFRMAEASGERPISKYSEKSGGSGNSVYYEARSRPETPELARLPRAFKPANGVVTPPYSQSAKGRSDGYAALPESPPAYDYDENRTRNPSPLFANRRTSSPELPPGTDVLDLPVPQRLTQFASGSTLQSSDESDIGAGGNVGNNRLRFSPSLMTRLPSPAVWRQTAGSTPSPGSFGVESSNGYEMEGITIDLEEAPPAAGEGWRSLAQLLTAGRNSRTTFGVPNLVQGQNSSVSEAASLHSHLVPPSHRSTTSGGGSSVNLQNSFGSNSSRPSAHSQARSGRSAASAGSVTSDGRLRMRGPTSPALSAFGRGRLSPPPSLPSPPGLEMVPSMTSETSMDTTTGTLQTDRSPEPTSPGMHYLDAPWAVGLGGDWNPT